MAIHHIIPKHEWKARFGDLEGFDALDNLVNLTTEQHSQAHALLYEMIGRTRGPYKKKGTTIA